VETRFTEKTGAVAADRQVGQEQQVPGVAQVLDQRDRTDVQVAIEQGGRQPIGRVLVQVDPEQGARAHQAPVDRQAVEELDVTDPGTAQRLVRFARRRHGFPT
jgi:hypothetical protein